MQDRMLVLGTRGSALALWQANSVKDRLERLGLRIDLKEITTTGDRVLDVPFSQISDKALFTKEIDRALLDGTIHLAVHSLKDLPTVLPDGIRLAAVSEREDSADAFVAHPSFSGRLEDLPSGAVLATSSLRRQAQLKAWRRDLEIVPVRGNVDTRLEKLNESDWHGVILACAGLIRLGFEARIRERIDPSIIVPAVGQGALAVVCADEDESTYAVLRDRLHDEDSGLATAAERAFLRRLEGGCSVPVGGAGKIVRDGHLRLEGCVASLDGSRIYRGKTEGSSAKAEDIGVRLAETLLEQGADEILDEIRARQA